MMDGKNGYLNLQFTSSTVGQLPDTHAELITFAFIQIFVALTRSQLFQTMQKNCIRKSQEPPEGLAVGKKPDQKSQLYGFNERYQGSVITDSFAKLCLLRTFFGHFVRQNRPITSLQNHKHIQGSLNPKVACLIC